MAINSKLLWSILLLLGLAALCARAESYLVPTNPPPWVELAWDASPSTNVAAYSLYYGVGSRAYTTKVEVGTNLTAKVLDLTRGVRYYFSVTAHDRDGLESDFSNEVSWRPNLPPTPPMMKTLVVLSVQHKPAASNVDWFDCGMDWSIPPASASDCFRLKIINLPQVATAAFRPIPPLPPGL